VKTLLIGIGNPGRQDDGLGPALVERLAGSRPPERSVVQTSGGTVEAFWVYQLNIEDAYLLRDYEVVVFADACLEGDGPAAMGLISPAAAIAFTTHEMSPASVLALGEELYGETPLAFLLTIRGYAWEMEEGLTAEAAQNLDLAESLLVEFFQNWGTPAE
jgi:hydrogenase maturation protease